jgi:hypothetical protein
MIHDLRHFWRDFIRGIANYDRSARAEVTTSPGKETDGARGSIGGIDEETGDTR